MQPKERKGSHINWMSKTFGKKQLAFILEKEADSMCEHVEKDQGLAYASFNEDDSFGPVCRHVVCKPCYEKELEQEREEMVTCYDCHQKVKAGDTIQWKWYDFYAPQGDEALTICSLCQEKEKHKTRVAQDRADAEAEDEWMESRGF